MTSTTTEMKLATGTGRIWESAAGKFGWAHPDGSQGEAESFDDAVRALDEIDRDAGLLNKLNSRYPTAKFTVWRTRGISRKRQRPQQGSLGASGPTSGGSQGSTMITLPDVRGSRLTRPKVNTAHTTDNRSSPRFTRSSGARDPGRSRLTINHKQKSHHANTNTADRRRNPQRAFGSHRHHQG
jgi:hypothetical protein